MRAHTHTHKSRANVLRLDICSANDGRAAHTGRPNIVAHIIGAQCPTAGPTECVRADSFKLPGRHAPRTRKRARARRIHDTRVRPLEQTRDANRIYILA